MARGEATHRPSAGSDLVTSARAGRRFRTRRVGRLLFIVPAGAYLGALSVYPLVVLVHMSISKVTASTLTRGWPYVGLANYQQLVESAGFWAVFVHTLVYVAIVVVIGLLGGFVAASALRSSGGFYSIVMAVMVFVWALPPLVNGSIWKFLISPQGLVTWVLHAAHVSSTAGTWLETPVDSLVVVAVVNGWSTLPFAALVFRSALLDIPYEHFEAAAVDGARPVQVTRYITLPAVRPTTYVLTLLLLIYAFRAFDYTYVLTQGGPGTSSTTLPYLSYFDGFSIFDFGLASAVSVVTIVLLVGMGTLYANSVRREEAK